VDKVLDFVLDAPGRLARFVADRLQAAFEFACLTSAAVGVFLNWGRGWGLIASGVLGVIYLELPDILALFVTVLVKRKRVK